MNNPEQLPFRPGVAVNLPFLEIRSDRLVLRPINEAYARAIFSEFTPNITTYMMPKPADDIEETLTFIRGAVAGILKGQELVMVILSHSEEFLGCVGLHGGRSSGAPELGIWIKESAHGRGYGREAVHAMFNWAEDHVDASFYTYPVATANWPSRKIPESLGGVVVANKVVRTQRGTEMDEVIYHIPSRRLTSQNDL